MQLSEEKLREIIRAVIKEQCDPYAVPIGVSNHHIHLTKEDFSILFPNQEMTVKKPLKQPGEFASDQTVTIIGPNGNKIENVRVLGPCRSHSQVEIAKSETFALGMNVPIRMSGDLEGAPSVKLCTPDGMVTVQGVIIAKRHIHMSMEDAARYGVKLGDVVSVEINTPERSTVFNDVICRPREGFVLEMHIDTDEASAANVGGDTQGKIIVPNKK